MRALIPSIGLSVIICQQIEVLLGAILLLERRERFHSDELFINAAAQVRTQSLEVLKNELAHLKVGYIQFSVLDTVIDRRNWIVHRLVFDERFQKAFAEGSQDNFVEHLSLFHNFWITTYDAYERRLAEVGGEWDTSNVELLASFAAAIRDKTEKLRAGRKKKKSD